VSGAPRWLGGVGLCFVKVCTGGRWSEEPEGGGITAMCPADSVAMNRIILKEGLFIAAMFGRCAKRLWLLVIGTSDLRFRRRGLRQIYGPDSRTQHETSDVIDSSMQPSAARTYCRRSNVIIRLRQL